MEATRDQKLILFNRIFYAQIRPWSSKLRGLIWSWGHSCSIATRLRQGATRFGLTTGCLILLAKPQPEWGCLSQFY